MGEYSTVERTAYPSDAMFTTGKKVKLVRATITITNGTHASGDVFRLVKGLSFANKILAIFVPKETSAIAGMTDVDFGVYKTNAGGVVDKDILVDGQSFAAAVGVGDLIGANAYKSIGQALSKNNDKEYSGGVDICATLNATPSASGTLTFWIIIA